MTQNRKKVLALNFFPAFTPPKSGGELRYYHIYRHLREYYDVTMVNPTHLFVEPEVVHHFPNMVEYRIPKGKVHLNLHRFLSAIGGFPECSAVVVMLASRRHTPLRAKVEELLDGANIVIHEHPFLAPLMHKRKGQLLLYDAHNVEYDLHRQMLRGALGRMLCWLVKRAEGRLCREADLIFATSEEDRRRLTSLYDVSPMKIIVIPNGVDTGQVRPATPEERRLAREKLSLSESPALLFFGSAHPPNKEAVEFIMKGIAPRFPGALFLIAGDVCKHFEGREEPNIRFLGRVDEEEKQLLIHGVDVALNPMFSGSGTNLKMFDYLAAGLPIVATPTGVRGIALANFRDAIVTEADDFEASVREVLERPDMRAQLSYNGRRFVEEYYQWSHLVRRMHETIEGLGKPRITVINDFAIDSPRHGGQYRISSLYGELSKNLPVTYLCLQKETDEIEEKSLSENFIQYAIPKGFYQRVCESLMGRLFRFTVDDILGIFFAHRNRLMRREVAQSAAFGDILICVHPYQWRLLKPFKDKIRIYEALNYETVLKGETLRGVSGKILLGFVRGIERRAVLESTAILTVSDEEGEAFERTFGVRGKCTTIPNGTDTARVAPPLKEEKEEWRAYLNLPSSPIAIFVGSAHPPNVEAGHLLIERIAPRTPYVLFFIVGSVCWVLKNLSGRTSNVKLFFEVEEPVRNILFKTADFAVNPMVTGAGTSLKMFDFLAAGLPVISTPLGARGMAKGDDKLMVLCDVDEFPSAIMSLLGDIDRMMRLGLSGRRHVEEHSDWRIIARHLHATLQSLQQSASGGNINEK
ncbi:MAG: glycosyltransferase family 4 protein [Candidatus Sumerlaeota bacterium]|nr:glycosyltransferase family 4 protein [Candidatus Sumerlaeota bacterium]